MQVLVLDGKMQSAEIDEFIYHECLIHPSLLCHPKYVFYLFIIINQKYKNEVYLKI